jgi:putative ABC transport system permease protein
MSFRRAVSLATASTSLRVIGADPGALRVIAPRLTQGRLFDDFHDAGQTRVVLLPRSAADELGITRLGVAVFVADRAYTVMGIYDDVVRRPEAMYAAIMPFRTADLLASSAPGEPERDVIIETAPGAAQLIARQAPLALWPQQPDTLTAVAPPDPRTLRREIEGNLARSSLILSIVAFIIGAVTIATAAIAGVSARVPEIGLRRAVGATASQIFAQLLAETTILGAVGGSIGALLGVFVTSLVSLWNAWTPVVDPRLALLASASGAAAGMLAGLLPAARAIRIQPVIALQR